MATLTLEAAHALVADALIRSGTRPEAAANVARGIAEVKQNCGCKTGGHELQCSGRPSYLWPPDSSPKRY